MQRPTGCEVIEVLAKVGGGVREQVIAEKVNPAISKKFHNEIFINHFAITNLRCQPSNDIQLVTEKTTACPAFLVHGQLCESYGGGVARAFELAIIISFYCHHIAAVVEGHTFFDQNVSHIGKAFVIPRSPD
jgi:hypothetical protein